jgi:hypothetical protein
MDKDATKELMQWVVLLMLIAGTIVAYLLGNKEAASTLTFISVVYFIIMD